MSDTVSDSRIISVNRSLIAVNVAIFLFVALTTAGRAIYPYLALWPLPHSQLWQFVTYAFIHGGLLHLAFNMFGLWVFGNLMEETWGGRRYALYYVTCVAGAALLHLTASAMAGHVQFMVGASGGVFGVLFAFAKKYPDVELILLPILVPVKAKYVISGLVVLSLWFGITDTIPQVAHFAHLGGMLFGWLLLQQWR